MFVNGLPLAVIECKNPTIGDTWKAEAVKQLHRYHEAGNRWKDQGAPKLFEAVQVLVATCGERAAYGTVGTPERFFLQWKEPYPLTVKQLAEKLGRTPTPQDILLYGLLEPKNVLEIVRNFVVFEVDGGRTVRKLIRYKAQTARTCIYGHLEEHNADDPAVSHLETDDNVPGREHELGRPHHAMSVMPALAL